MKAQALLPFLSPIVDGLKPRESDHSVTNVWNFETWLWILAGWIFAEKEDGVLDEGKPSNKVANAVGGALAEGIGLACGILGEGVVFWALADGMALCTLAE